MEVFNPDLPFDPRLSEDYGNYSKITQQDLLARIANAIEVTPESETLPIETVDSFTHVQLNDFVKSSGGYEEVNKYGAAFAELKKAGASRAVIGSYLGTSGLDINKSLRGDSSIELTAAQRDAIDGLEAAFAKNIVDQQFDTFRGLSTRSLFGDLEGDELDEAMADLVGSTMSDSGFMSTSLSAFRASGFSKKAKVGEAPKDRPTVIMRIKVPAGRSAIYIGPGMTILQEDEVILPRDTNLKVNGVTLVKSVGPNGTPAYILDVEVVS
jgi:hypothetical protein